MRYQEFEPSPALASNVECIWTLSGEAPGAPVLDRVFPDGCVELIVHLGEPFLDAGMAPQPRALVVGQLTRPMWLAPPSRFETWGVRFRPWGAYAALDVDVHELVDGAQPLEALWGREARDVVEAARRSHDALEQVLSRRLDRQPHAATLQAARLFLQHRGTARVDRVAKEVGWTERHLERRFAREIGLSPKAFSRTVRFQHTLALMHSDGRDDWAGIAWDGGFADQAHLIREFRELAGVTPGRVREEALRLAGRFVQPQRLARYFAG